MKHNILAQALSSLNSLDPLTPSRTPPESLEEAYSTALCLRAIVLAKNRPDSTGSFVCVLERYFQARSDTERGRESDTDNEVKDSLST